MQSEVGTTTAGNASERNAWLKCTGFALHTELRYVWQEIPTKLKKLIDYKPIAHRHFSGQRVDLGRFFFYPYEQTELF